MTTASPARIRSMRYVTALVAPDTVELLAERVTNLLSHGRRIAITYRVTDSEAPPEVIAGLTVDGRPQLSRRTNGTVFTVLLQPGLGRGFGFATSGEDPTEELAWCRFHAAQSNRDRAGLTEVRVKGGLPSDGPAADDSIVIRHWNSEGVRVERVVAFDYASGNHNALTTVRDELRTHLDNLSDKQPWDNRAMFERLMAALDARAATDGGDE